FHPFTESMPGRSRTRPTAEFAVCAIPNTCERCRAPKSKEVTLAATTHIRGFRLPDSHLPARPAARGASGGSGSRPRPSPRDQVPSAGADDAKLGGMPELGAQVAAGLLSALLPARAVTVEMRADASAAELFPAEDALVARAVD